MATGAALLSYLHAHQKLGAPAVRTMAQENSDRLKIVLPERVLDYASDELPITEQELDILPKDTSLGRRRYRGSEGSVTDVSVVLMGTDRTSMHRPEFCLSGQGWVIDDVKSRETLIHMDKPISYDLPAKMLVASKQIVLTNDQKILASGVYLHWFVAQDELTSKHSQCMYWMARDMLLTGVLKRWAYISYFSTCLPGQEEATIERLKRFVSASVPEFQLTPAAVQTASARK